VLAAVPAVATAQTAPEVRDVVVTASRLGSIAALSPFDIQTLPQTEIAPRRSVAEALQGLAEIHVQAPGGRSGFASIFLRGADPNFTAVMLDGVPLNNPTNSRGGSVNISEIDTPGIERVEVVTGPLTSLYGSGALSGAVNLIVAGGAPDNTVTAMAAAGTREDYAGSLQWRGSLQPGLGGSLTLSGSDDGDMVEGASFRTWALTGKLERTERPEDGRLLFRFTQTEAEAFPESSGGPRLATLRGVDHRDAREALVAASQSVFRREGFRFDLSGSYLSRRDETETPGVAPSAFDPVGLPAGSDDSRYKRVLGQAIARFDGAGWSAAAGAEAQHETGKSEGELVFFGFPMPAAFDLERTTVSGFLEAQRATSNWTFNAGARVDDVEGLDARVTGRAGVRYLIPGSRVSLRASVGSAFKAPSFYALGNPFVGNPDLKPERSRTGEVGLVWNGEGGDYLSAGLFRTEFKDLIDFDPGPPPRLTNRSSVVSKGASVAGAKALTPQLRATAQVQYADTFDSDTGNELLNRPKWRATASLAWSPSTRLGFTARYSYVGERGDYAVPTGVQDLEAYHLVSLEAAYRVTEKTGLRLVVDNALDGDYEEAIGVPTPPLRARVMLTQRF
jgi:outer membrane cobalamin receptor